MIIRILCCLFFLAACIYLYIDRLNKVTEERLKIPELKKELKILLEENIRLQYEIERFENPIHLLELASKSEFSHLKFPFREEVILIEEK